MRRFLFGLVVGATVAGLAVAAVAHSVLADKYQHGRYMGNLEGRMEAMQAIEAEFGQVAWPQAGKSLFSLKTSAVVAVVVDGVKTVRVAP